MKIGRRVKQRKALTVSVVVSICWHICFFSLFYVAFPGISKHSRTDGITFIGSFLKGYDFDSCQAVSSRHSNRYFQLAKQNAGVLNSVNYAKLDNLLEKPRNNFFTNKADAQHLSFLDERFLKQNFSIDDLNLRNNDFFDAKNLPDVNIYFKEGIPGQIKFDLYINEKGRVVFLNKLITSGSFDADMIIKRALIRMVFDTDHFGSNHRRTLELDLKNDRH